MRRLVSRWEKRVSSGQLLIIKRESISCADNGIGSDFALVSIKPELQSWVFPTQAVVGGPCGAYTEDGTLPEPTEAAVTPATPVGQIARRFDLRSPFGATLDPVADKLSMLVVTVLLAWQELLPLWLAAAIVLRDCRCVRSGPTRPLGPWPRTGRWHGSRW